MLHYANSWAVYLCIVSYSCMHNPLAIMTTVVGRYNKLTKHTSKKGMANNILQALCVIVSITLCTMAILEKHSDVIRGSHKVILSSSTVLYQL